MLLFFHSHVHLQNLYTYRIYTPTEFIHLQNLYTYRIYCRWDAFLFNSINCCRLFTGSTENEGKQECTKHLFQFIWNKFLMLTYTTCSGKEKSPKTNYAIVQFLSCMLVPRQGGHVWRKSYSQKWKLIMDIRQKIL